MLFLMLKTCNASDPSVSEVCPGHLDTFTETESCQPQPVTVMMATQTEPASPSSVRRSARIKDSPAVNYKDSLR